MKKFLIRILKIIILIGLIEIFVFNFNSFRVLSNKDKKEFSKSDIVYVETEEQGITLVQIENINSEIKTVHLALEHSEVVEYQILYTDETTSNFFGVPAKTYVESLENSKYVPCYFSGDSEILAIKIYADNIEIDSISINEKIPFKFNWARAFILCLIIIFIYEIKTNKIFEMPFSKKEFKQELVLLGILASFLAITCYINDYSKQSNKYDFYSYDFVNAILEGNVSLGREVNERLAELENPYDGAQRINAGLVRDIDYIWDAALYEGKYYVYFGILPALILMIPYHILTNKYMICATAVLIFSILTAISIKSLVKNIFNRFFKDVPFKFMVYSLLILLFGSQILVLNGIPRFYEVPIISGMFFAIAGINFMFRAMEKEDVNYKYMLLSCLFLSLAVACRPTQLLTSLIILPVIIKVFVDNIKQKKNILKNILAVCTPYLTVGILLMIYNYVRFGNIFEFGASYQITINDMSHLRNRFMVIGMGLVCNLLSIPNFVPSFPFIYNHNNLLTFYGYYYIENMIGGLFILVPICFSIFGIRKIFKESKNKETSKFILIFMFVRNNDVYIKHHDGGQYAKIYCRLCLDTYNSRNLHVYRAV